MPRAILQQGAWNAGELSPRVYGRSDQAKYAAGAKRMENVLLHPAGGFQKRSGTRFVATAYTSTAKSLLIPFRFSNDDAYALEFSSGPASGVGTIRFYRNGAQVLATARNFDGRVSPTGGIILAADTITIVGHYFATGQGPFRLTNGGTLPTPLDTVTDYYIIKVDADTIKLATSYANAVAGTAVNLTVVGTIGPHTIGAAVAGMPAAQVNHTYTDSELYEMEYAESGDVLYLVQKSHPPADLSRHDHAEWTLANHTFDEGPFLGINTTATTIAWPVTGTGASNTFTASASLFVANDVGRQIRIQTQASGKTFWGLGTITAYLTPTTVTVRADRQFPAGGTSPSAAWFLSAFYTGNYPRAVSVVQSRLALGGEPANPESIHLSLVNNYKNFAPNGLFTPPPSVVPNVDNQDTESNHANGTVNADTAIDLTFGANDVQAIKFLAVGRDLIVGTVGGIWPVNAPNDAGLTVDDATTHRASAYGAALRQAVQVDELTVHISRERRRLRTVGYTSDKADYGSADLNHLADHIGVASQFTQLAFQQEPDTTVWVVREDGIAAACTFQRDENVLGWCRHWLGGSYGTGRTVVESMAVIPTSGSDADQVWLSTVRTINGATFRAIEVMDPRFESTTAIEDGYFVDCGVTAPTTPAFSQAITGISIAATAVVTVGSTAGLNNGDRIRIWGVLGVSTTDSYGTVTNLVNGRYFLVANKTGTTFELQTLAAVNYPTTGGSAWSSGGTAQNTVSTLSGLTWLKNTAVVMNADGSYQSGTVDGSGNLTLTTPAARIQVGLSYTSLAETLPLQFDDPAGSGQGRFNRPAMVVLRVLQTSHLKLGRSDFDLDAIPEVEASSAPTTTASVLFSGDVRVTVPGGWERGQGLILSHELPLPWEQVSAMISVESGGT